MIASTKQLAIGFHGQSAAPQPQWFGLRLTHRALFDALQTEWLSPVEAIGGHLLLATSFAPVIRGADESRHPIEIGLRLDLARLPDLPLMVLRGGTWVPPRGRSIARPSSARERVEPNVPEVPGLIYLDPFLSEQDEADIVARVDDAPWRDDLERRVQHYGWRYDYKARRVGRDMRIGSLPPWAQRLADRLFSEGLLPWVADQVIVNEYVGKQGISKHIDCVPCFEEAISMISLLESWSMRFTHAPTKRKVEHRLGRRSIAIMTGESRYDWSHEIPSRKKEPSGLVRQRRISLTFRRVKLP